MVGVETMDEKSCHPTVEVTQGRVEGLAGQSHVRIGKSTDPDFRVGLRGSGVLVIGRPEVCP